MSLSRVQFLLPVMVIALAWVSPAQAGFDYTPPTGKQTAPVTVPDVQAEPLEEPAAAPVTQAAPAPAEEPVLKIKTVTPASTEAPAPEEAAPLSVPPMAPPAPAAAPKAAEISNPPADMDMPQNPGLSGQAKPTLATVSVPPEATDAPLSAPPTPAPVIIEEKPAPAVAAIEPPPPVEEKKKPGLSINPYPLKDGAKSAAAPVVSPRPAYAPRAADPQGEYAMVEGFGSDMALALALREVVPAHYSFSFAKGVNPGYRVSWNGGKPWNQVVREMIAPLDLTYEIRGNAVVIRPAAVNEIPGKRADAAPFKAPEAVPMAPPSEESSIETASGEETPAMAAKEEQKLKKPETFQLSSSNAAAPNPGQPRIWEAKQGASLKETLDQWSTEAEIDLVWKAAHDYKIDSGVLVSGSFENAVKVLFMHGLDPANAPRHSRSPDSLLIEDQTS